jgi:hypothetical protein
MEILDGVHQMPHLAGNVKRMLVDLVLEDHLHKSIVGHVVYAEVKVEVDVEVEEEDVGGSAVESWNPPQVH